MAGAGINIYSFFPPPPQAGDGENKVCLCHVCTISTSKTKQRFACDPGTAEGQEEKCSGRVVLLGGGGGIKQLLPHSEHLSPFQTSLKGAAASPLVFQNGTSFSSWPRGGNSCPGLRKQIICSFPFPLMVLLALVVPFHQRGSTPMPYLCHLKAVQD